MRRGRRLFRFRDRSSAVTNAKAVPVPLQRERVDPEADDVHERELRLSGSSILSSRRSLPLQFFHRGALAQLGERQLCKLEVTGSIPVRSIREGPGNRPFLLFEGSPTSVRPADWQAVWQVKMPGTRRRRWRRRHPVRPSCPGLISEPSTRNRRSTNTRNSADTVRTASEGQFRSWRRFGGGRPTAWDQGREGPVVISTQQRVSVGASAGHVGVAVPRHGNAGHDELKS